jgi:hypothetical protein
VLAFSGDPVELATAGRQGRWSPGRVLVGGSAGRHGFNEKVAQPGNVSAAPAAGFCCLAESVSAGNSPRFAAAASSMNALQ